MKLFGHGNESMIQKHLKSSKLALPYIEYRICELAVIESTAECYLKTAGIDYQKLKHEEAWTILVGAWRAMNLAEEHRAVKTKRLAENVPDVFLGLLKQGIPMDYFVCTCNVIGAGFRMDGMEDLKNKFKTVFHHTEFEADIRLLSIVVGANITSVQSEAGQHKLQDALYQFYLCAQDDYFQGEGASKEGQGIV